MFNLISQAFSSITFIKGWLCKIFLLGGGVTAFSFFSAAYSKPDVVMEKSEQIARSAYNAGYGVISALFTGTREIIADFTATISSGAARVWDYLFTFKKQNFEKEIPEFVPPDHLDSLTWWNWIFKPQRLVTDAVNTFIEWSPVSMEIYTLDPKENAKNLVQKILNKITGLYLRYQGYTEHPLLGYSE